MKERLTKNSSITPVIALLVVVGLIIWKAIDGMLPKVLMGKVPVENFVIVMLATIVPTLLFLWIWYRPSHQKRQDNRS